MTRATLHTERIELVPLADEHLELEIELDSDPQVLRYLIGRARTRAEVEQVHEQRMARAADGLGSWIGFTSGEFVGWWVLESPLAPDGTRVAGQAGLGYRLLRRRWRQGLASEGARELLRHGFDDLGLHRVFAQTMAVNTASRATMAALGMTHVRTFTVEFDDPLPGTEHGEVEYELTRPRWQTLGR